MLTNSAEDQCTKSSAWRKREREDKHGEGIEKWVRRVMFPREADELAKLKWEESAIVLSTWTMCS